MLGSATLKTLLDTQSSLTVNHKTTLEMNANGAFSYDYAGIYQDGSVTTYSQSGGSVPGAVFTTRYVKAKNWVQTTDTLLSQIRQVDEEDWRYSENFPVASIFEEYRPGPGIVRLALDSRPVGQQTWPGTHIPSDTLNNRFYPCDPNAEFKYWRSGTTSTSTGSILYASPFIHYTQPFYANKIVVSVQKYITFPKTYSIQYLNPTNNTWTTAYSNQNWPANGALEIYYNGASWSTTPAFITDTAVGAGQAVRMQGIRFVCTEMTVTFTPLEVVEISPRLIFDVSDRVMDFSVEENFSEEDSPLPVGSISANGGSMKLFNGDSAFEFSDSGLVTNGYNTENAIVVNSVRYYHANLSGGYEDVLISRMLVDDWNETEEREIAVKMLDTMKRLQEIDGPDALWMNKSLSQIVVRLCDWAGHTGVEFVTDSPNAAEDPVIPYFKARKTEKVYNLLRDLAEATQCAMFFDRNNMLQVHTKEKIMSAGAAVAGLRYNQDGANLPNIVEFDSDDGKPINEITIVYKHNYVDKNFSGPYEIKDPRGAALKNKIEPVWTPPSDLVLGSAPIVNDLLSSDTIVRVDQEAGLYFAWSGYIILGSEIIQYRGKQFQLKFSGEPYYTFVWINDEEEYNRFRKSIATNSRMSFTGAMKIIQRGAFNTLVQNHYTARSTGNPFPRFSLGNCCPQKYLGGQGASMTTASVTGTRYTSDDWYALTKAVNWGQVRIMGPQPDEYYRYSSTNQIVNTARQSTITNYYGYSLRNGVYDIFKTVAAGVRILGRAPDPSADNKAGPRGLEGIAHIGLDWSTLMQGWYLEVELSATASENNVRLVKRGPTTSTTVVSGTVDIQPSIANVNPGTVSEFNNASYLHLELSRFPYGGNLQKIEGRVNGNVVVTYLDPYSLPHTGAFGMGVRGNTYADFDYFWAGGTVTQNTSYSLSDTDYDTNTSVLDARYGGIVPNAFNSMALKNMWNPAVAPLPQQGIVLYEEFGPIAHEARIIKADFGDKAVINPYAIKMPAGARDYMIPMFNSTPYEAEFVLCNTARHAVVFGSSVQFNVSGTVVQNVEQTLTSNNFFREWPDPAIESQIKLSKTRFGVSELKISSDYIQSRGFALNLMRWMLKYSSLDCDIIKTKIFGNPLIETGDIVSVLYSEHGYNGSEKFVVVSATNSFANGYETELVLRRISI